MQQEMEAPNPRYYSFDNNPAACLNQTAFNVLAETSFRMLTNLFVKSPIFHRCRSDQYWMLLAICFSLLISIYLSLCFKWLFCCCKCVGCLPTPPSKKKNLDGTKPNVDDDDKATGDKKRIKYLQSEGSRTIR